MNVPPGSHPRALVEAARSRGCETVQIFSSNPRAWALPRTGPDRDAQVRELLEEADIHPLLLHTPYLVNIGAPDPDTYARSVATIVHAADRARRLDAYVVVHAGRTVGTDRTPALRRAAAAVLTALKLCPDTKILVEPTSGGRGSVASTIAETAELLACVDDDRVGLCLDTCHLHVAGHDLSRPRSVRATLDEAHAAFGLSRVVAIHANDAKDPAGSCRDRHESLGRGTIGAAGFRAFLSDPRLGHAAVVCETPGDIEEDRANVERARTYARGTRRVDAPIA